MMPNVDDVIAYESGQMDEDEAIEFFQGLINSGAILHLQGSYQRTAQMLMDNGMCLTPSEFAEGERVAAEAAAHG